MHNPDQAVICVLDLLNTGSYMFAKVQRSLTLLFCRNFALSRVGVRLTCEPLKPVSFQITEDH